MERMVYQLMIYQLEIALLLALLGMLRLLHRLRTVKLRVEQMHVVRAARST